MAQASWHGAGGILAARIAKNANLATSRSSKPKSLTSNSTGLLLQVDSDSYF